MFNKSLFAMNHVHKSVSAEFNNCIRVSKSLPFNTIVTTSQLFI